MHEVLVNCLFKLAQEKVWLGTLTMTIAVDMGQQGIKQQSKQKNCSFQHLKQMFKLMDKEKFFYWEWSGSVVECLT